MENLAAHPRAAATEGRGVGANPLALAASSVDTSTPALTTSPHQTDVSHPVSAATPAASFDPSTIPPLIGDLAGFNFNLLGTPFALVTALDIAGQVAIADLSRGMVQNLLHDVSASLELNVGTALGRLTGDLNAATDAVNKIADSLHNRPPGTDSGTTSGTARTRQSAAGSTTPE
jgi:hypothetical protein